MTCKCKNCESRTLGCHDTCPAYAEYKAYIAKLKEQDRAKHILTQRPATDERKIQRYKNRYRRVNL